MWWVEYWVLALFPEPWDADPGKHEPYRQTTHSLKHGLRDEGCPQGPAHLWPQVWTQPIGWFNTCCSSRAWDAISARRQCLTWWFMEKRHQYQVSRSVKGWDPVPGPLDHQSSMFPFICIAFYATWQFQALKLKGRDQLPAGALCRPDAVCQERLRGASCRGHSAPAQSKGKTEAPAVSVTSDMLFFLF